MDRKYLEELIRSIQSLIKCPNCGSSYQTNTISILGGSSNQAFLVHLKCSLCGLPTLATVMFKHEGMPESQQQQFSEGMDQFELDQAQKPIFNSSLPKRNTESKLNTDDVLNMHRFLENFDGDFGSTPNE
jgi:ribosomal protein L32